MYYGMMWLAAYEDRAVGNKYVQVTTGTGGVTSFVAM
jgi:hypothetical protein